MRFYQPQRRGVAATELAIGLPVLVLMVFGAMQAGRSVQLRHIGIMITDEISRKAADPATVDSELITETLQLAEVSGLQGTIARVVHSPSDKLVRIELEIPLSSNYSGPKIIPAQPNILAATTGFRNY